jgi:hypothetical protein
MLMKFDLQLGRDDQFRERMTFKQLDNETTEVTISGKGIKVYESEMLSLIEQRECHIDAKIVVQKMSLSQYEERERLQYDQETLVMHQSMSGGKL